MSTWPLALMVAVDHRCSCAKKNGGPTRQDGVEKEGISGRSINQVLPRLK